MKNQVLKQIEKLVKEFNEKNADFGKEKMYEISSSKFARGSYSCMISYRLFFSTDLSVLMNLCQKENLLVMLGTFNGKGAYMSIQ